MNIEERVHLLVTGKFAPSGEPELDRRIPISRVAQFFGVTRRTIDRWRKNPAMRFPQPISVNSRRYFRLSEIVAWEQPRERGQGEVSGEGKRA